MPPSEKFVFNFNSKEELKRWHLHSDSEFGGLSTASLEITDVGSNEELSGMVLYFLKHAYHSSIIVCCKCYSNLFHFKILVFVTCLIQIW